MDVTDLASLSRRPSSRDRPQNAPMGPRTRHNSARNSFLPSDASAGSHSPRQSAIYTGASPRYSAPSSADHSDSKALAAITEREYDSPPTPDEEDPPVPSNDPPAPPPAPEVPAELLNITAVPKVAALTLPPQVKFDSVPVKWKGLPLEAALWTFNSRELQDLVSRAIRSSSRESFIRVLSVENLDQSLPGELERLNALKAMTQSKYRFTAHRRTMLLQALHSFSGYNDRAQDAALVAKLTGQLSQTTAECDQLLGDLLQIADQVGQITRLLDVHWASALAIALRKLNSSYGRRTSELIAARDKITTLNAELNDAWQQAEKLAREMDELEAAAGSDNDEDEAVIEVAEVISLNHRKSPSASSYLSLRPTLSIDALSSMYLDHSPATEMQSQAEGTTEEQSQAAEPTPTTEESEATIPLELQEEAQTTEPTSTNHVESQTQTTHESHPISPSLPFPSPSETDMASPVPETPVSPRVVEPEASETASIHSAKSGRSGRSMRSAKSGRTARTTDTSRVSTVSAARRRSLRTSMGSLRMPSIKVRKGSHPPVPSLPSISPVPSPSSPIVTSDRRSTTESFLDFSESREASES
ncbi:hypothetical protein DFH09DRAFT_502789 [Mycena vulgaris]|nr:hypothetical protein DFH09DRAFT_502789 [Mycena vulgaris]